MNQKHCKRCGNSFVTGISYQIYCSAECREEATKEKISERYAIVKRKKRAKNLKTCRSCPTKLSVYNEDSICSTCAIDPDIVSKTLRELRGISNGKPISDES
jgi:hypothetical protein